MNKAFLAVLSLFCLPMLQNSCVAPVDGCLDTLGSNYDLSADQECPDSCCTYPAFALSVNYKFDTLNLDSSEYYNINADSYFRLRGFYMALSEFSFQGDFGDEEIINEDNETINDDLALVFYRNSSITPGNVRLDGVSLDQVNFSIGLPSSLENINVSQEYPVLEILRDSVYLDSMTNQFYELGFQLEVDSISQETQWFQYSNVDFATQYVVSQEVEKGNSVRLQLNIDFLRLFQEIDFQSTDLNVKIEDAINLNLLEAITIE